MAQFWFSKNQFATYKMCSEHCSHPQPRRIKKTLQGRFLFFVFENGFAPRGSPNARSRSDDGALFHSASAKNHAKLPEGPILFDNSIDLHFIDYFSVNSIPNPSFKCNIQDFISWNPFYATIFIFFYMYFFVFISF